MSRVLNRHTEGELKAAIAWCIKKKRSPAYWCLQLRQLRNDQLRQNNRALRRTERAAGTNQ